MSEENVNVSAQEQEQEKIESFQPEPVKEEKAPLSGWKKIVAKVGIGCALAAVLFTIIFIFTVGIDITTTVGSESDVESYDLFYYFESFEKTVKSIESNPNLDPLYALARIWRDCVGILATCALLVVTIIFCIIAAIKGIIAITKGTENNFFKFSAIAFASFFVFSNAFIAVNANAQISPDASIIVGVSSSAVTGIVLSGLFLLASFGCKVAVNFKDYVNKNTIMGIVGSSVKVVMVILITCLMVYSVTQTKGEVTFHNASFSIASSFANSESQKRANISTTALISGFIYIPLTIMMLASVINAATELDNLTKPVSLRMPIAVIVLSVLYMIFSMVTANMINELKNVSEYSATMPIVVVVLAIINLAGAIVMNVGNKKKAA